MSIRTKLILMVASLTICAPVAFAQQPQTNTQTPNTTPGAQQPGPRWGRRGMRRHGEMGKQGGIQQLNLTDDQKQQVRSIIQTQSNGTKAQREELWQLMQQRRAGTLTPEGQARAQVLRKELMEGRKAAHAQMLNVLTADQKAKLEQMKQERRANREKFRAGKKPVS